MYLGLNVSSSSHNCVCMVDGGNAIAGLLNHQIYILRNFHVVQLLFDLDDN